MSAEDNLREDNRDNRAWYIVIVQSRVILSYPLSGVLCDKPQSNNNNKWIVRGWWEMYGRPHQPAIAGRAGPRQLADVTHGEPRRVERIAGGRVRPTALKGRSRLRFFQLFAAHRV